MNWYAYTGNDPLNNSDPTGLNDCVATQGNGCIDEPPPPCECENRPQLLPVLTKIITEAISGLGNILHSESDLGDSLPTVEEGTSETSKDQLPEVKPNTLESGAHAGESIPARGSGRDFTPEERTKVNEIGEKTGCHTCGNTEPGTQNGNFIPDHQPPNALNPQGGQQQLYPHCIGCSRLQGGQVNASKYRK